MRLLIMLTITVTAVVLSCTKEKTNYEAEIDTVVPEYTEYSEAATLTSAGLNIRVEALNGTFYKGYNSLRLKVTNAETDEDVDVTSFTFLPIYTDADGEQQSGPHQYQLTRGEDGYFSGYAVFTEESTETANWQLYVNFDRGGQTVTIDQTIEVEAQTNQNLNMTSFVGNDGGEYIIALVSPQRPTVSENQLVAGIYRYNEPVVDTSANFPDPTQFSFTEVAGYTLRLDPRMPEPSMGNHSSPNNQDLTQQEDGLYHGVVNYTMTGNWTLNFILQNQNGQILKGTVVPDDFTPGVNGVKSELFIDILF